MTSFSFIRAGGVSLRLRGENVPNGGFVDYEDIMYTAPEPCCNDLPSNRNTRVVVQSHQVPCVLSVVTGTFLMGTEWWTVLMVYGFELTEVQMKSLVMGQKLMAQFVSIVDIVQHREAVSVVSYPMLLMPVLTRPSMLTFVSLQLIAKIQHIN